MGYVCGIRTLGPDDDVILISTDGIIIRFRANDMRVMGRSATGVRVMRLGEESRVASFTRTQHDDSESAEEIENVSDEERQASLSEDASEVIESDTAPDDDNVEDNAENSDVKSDEDTEE